MDGEVVSGLIGLGGALLGGGVSVWATKVTQRQQTRDSVRQLEDARSRLIEERGRAAGEKALAELYALRRHLAECSRPEIPADHQPWRKIARDHMDEAELAVGLMPQASVVRDRIEEVLGITSVSMARSDNLVSEVQQARWGAVEAIGILSAYMRSDPLPEISGTVRGYREHAAHAEAQYALEEPPDEE